MSFLLRHGREKTYSNRQVAGLRTIILDMQSGLYARAIQRILAQEMEDCHVVISNSPADTAAQCRLLQPYALLMEVTGYTPWKMEERLAICSRVKREAALCKVLLIVDDKADQALAEEVKRAKQSGRIDAFLFTSASESYLVAVMDSL